MRSAFRILLNASFVPDQDVLGTITIFDSRKGKFGMVGGTKIFVVAFSNTTMIVYV